MNALLPATPARPDDALLIEGAEVLLPDGLARVSVRIEDGGITGLDVAADGARRVAAPGMLLAPALVDIHGDAFERQLMPRPGVLLPVEAALLETDRQLAANGIATAYHALTLSWEPGLRSVQMGWDVLGTLNRIAPRLTVENRLQLRWETFCFEAVPLIEAALAGPLTPSVAFNDHTSMILLDPSVALQDRPFEHAPGFPVTAFDNPVFLAKMELRAKRSQMETQACVELIREVWSRRPQVPPRIAEVAALGRKAGAAMLSHDDTRAETRDFYRALGAGISEFPMNMATARAARDAGDQIVFGAPNAARGGSHLGSPGAAAMVAEGLCDILASDYYYPALLSAVARLRADRVAPLERLWPLVAANPARALGLRDRGEIAPGQRADLVLVDWPEGQAPAVRQTLVAGRMAYGAVAAG